MARTRIEVKGLPQLVRKLQRMEVSAKDAFSDMIEAEGMKFLDEVQNRIIAYQAVDYRRLLNSFDKGGDGNVWSLTNGGLTLEVGTNVEYATYVNDGHNQSKRWVPGVWSGDRFIYQPGAKTGMMLTAKYISGRPYWDDAMGILERMFNTDVKRFAQAWINSQGR